MNKEINRIVEIMKEVMSLDHSIESEALRVLALLGELNRMAAKK
jgi:hypothetical protein